MWCEDVDRIHLAQVTGQWGIHEHGNEYSCPIQKIKYFVYLNTY